MFIYSFFFVRLFECFVVFLTFQVHQAGAENYRQYGPGRGSVSNSWAAYDMQRAQGQIDQYTYHGKLWNVILLFYTGTEAGTWQILRFGHEILSYDNHWGTYAHLLGSLGSFYLVQILSINVSWLLQHIIICSEYCLMHIFSLNSCSLQCITMLHFGLFLLLRSL